MNSKKMMLVSIIATVCLSILAVVSIMLVSQFQDGNVKQATDKVKAVSKKEPIEIESPEQEVAAFHSKGIRHYTDEYGTHDVYVEKDTSDKDYVGVTGPMHIKVNKVVMERLYAEKGVGKVLTEGNSEMTLVAITLDVKNDSGKKAYFELKTVRGKADNGEVKKVESILSDDFDLVYPPHEKRSGTIYFMYKGDPNKLATLLLNFQGAENAADQPIDKGVSIRVNLF